MNFDRLARRWRTGSAYGIDKNTFIKLVGECESCGSRGKLSIDHIIPTSLGGPNEWGNWQVLCGQCNAMKADWHPFLGGLPPCLAGRHKFEHRSEYKQNKILSMMKLVCRGYPEYSGKIAEMQATIATP